MLKARRNNRAYSGYSIRPMSNEELWADAARSIGEILPGYDINTQSDDLKEDILSHLRKFHLIHDYDMDQTLIAIQKFIVKHILDNKKEHYQFYDKAIGLAVMLKMGEAGIREGI